jgi:tripeptide aminopeptidase
MVDQYRNMRSYIEESDARTVHFAYEAAERLGLRLLPEAVRGGTDGSRLSEKGLPTPNIFNGGMDYHSCFEWNTVQNLERTLAFVKSLVSTWADKGHEPVDPARGLGS